MALTQSAPAQAVATNRVLQQDQDTTSAADLNREGERTFQIGVPVRCLSVTCPAARTLVHKPFQQTILHHATLPPTAASQLSMLLPSEYCHLPASGVAAKLAHTCSNHFKASLTTCSFHPNSARIVAGNKNGEMAIWELHNGFKFQKQFSAHHMARLTAMEWSNNEEYCITGDANGVVKYWKPTFEAHRLGMEGRHIHQDGGILDLAFAPTDTKFVSASEDSTVCVWDMHTCQLHRRIAAHAGDCTSVNWHPNTALLASGSRDTLVKLWDARSGTQITTYHGHQDRVNVVNFHWNGNWLISGSRDATCKLFELRMNRELHRYSAHSKDVNTIAWHPCIETLFASGSADQSIIFWLTDNEDPAYVSKEAHAAQVTCLKWHPLGHLLCSVGADAALKLWTRERPGDLLLGSTATSTIGQNQHVDPAPPGNHEPAADMLAAAIPGLGSSTSAKPVPPAAAPPAYRPPGKDAVAQQGAGRGPQLSAGRGPPSQPGLTPRPPPGPPPSGLPPRQIWNQDMQQSGANLAAGSAATAHTRPPSGGHWQGRGGRFMQQQGGYDDTGARERDRDLERGGGGRGGGGRDDWVGSGRGRGGWDDWGGGRTGWGRGRGRGRGRRGRS